MPDGWYCQDAPLGRELIRNCFLARPLVLDAARVNRHLVPAKELDVAVSGPFIAVTMPLNPCNGNESPPEAAQ
jgi:hypothetical protein